MPSTKTRDPYFDNLKGILIYLVFAGHCLSLYKGDNPFCAFLFQLIYAFHMPLFLYVSGYFSKHVARGAQTAYEALILPAIPFELAYFFLHWVTKADNFQPFLTPIFAYWYLFVLFGYRVLLPYLVKLRWILPISLLLALGVGFNSQIGEYMTLSRFFCLLPFFLLGYYTPEDIMDRMRHADRRLSLLLGLAGVVSLLAVWNGGLIPLDFTLAAPYEQAAGLAGRLFQFALAVLLSTAVIRFTPKAQSFLTHVGQRTLQIYLLNFYGMTAIQMLNPLAGFQLLNTILMLLLPAALTALFASPLADVPYRWLMDLTRKVLLKPEPAEEPHSPSET